MPVHVRSAGGTLATVTRDVGPNGMFVVTDQPRSVGEYLELRFALPGWDDPISVQCEVRWNRQRTSTDDGYAPGMGLRFVGLSVLVSGWIEEFLHNHERALRES